MPPQQDSLGNRHHAINNRTNETVRNKIPFADIENVPEKCDADRLYKIDVAAKYRHVPYILENLKSDDDLYVARALKKSPWLFSGEHPEFVNPEYLDNELFPCLNSRTVAKIKLELRLKLKDEKLSEEFFIHLATKYLNKEALKWLPKCSVPFIEEIIEEVYEKESKKIDCKLFKKLCERTHKVFEILTYSKRKSAFIYDPNYMRSVMFLLYSHTDMFLNRYEKYPCGFNFNKVATKFILDKAFDRVRSKIEYYIKNIDLHVLGKHLKTDEIEDFLVYLHSIESLSLWLCYKTIKPLITNLPKEDSYKIVKKLFIDKSLQSANIYRDEYCSISKRKGAVDMSNVYKWYAFAPFSVAFTELGKLVRTESSAEERMFMLRVLIECAAKNNDDLFKLVQYFRKYHIKEPAHNKASFVRALLKHTDGYVCEERTWKLLDEIFHSLGIYTEKDNKHVKHFYKFILNHCLIRDISIPELIKKLWLEDFSSLNHLRKHLDKTNQERVYNILRSQLQTELDDAIVNDSKLRNVSRDLISLLSDWNKDISYDTQIMDLLKYLKSDCKYAGVLKIWYYGNKKWRRDLFDVSLDLLRTKDVYVNVLKHKPEMIMQNRKTLDEITENGSVDMSEILRKIRVYFSDSLTENLLEYYYNKLIKCETKKGFKAVARGLCILMHKDRFEEFVRCYVPQNYKILWSEEDATLINIRKYLSQQMYLVRPIIEAETIFLFAKGDYLQTAMSSLISIFSRKSAQDIKKLITLLDDAQISLQKYLIRFALVKLSLEEIMEMLKNIWNINKNASIRALIFDSTHKLLCNDKGDVQAKWRLLKGFIENLTDEENRTIYFKLTDIIHLPDCVKGDFCEIAFKKLISMPPASNFQSLARDLFNCMFRYIEHMNVPYIEEIINCFIDDVIAEGLVNAIVSDYHKPYATFSSVIYNINAYIVCSLDVDEQAKRYLNVMKKITDECVLLWDETVNNVKVVKKFCKTHIIDDLIKKTLSQSESLKFTNPMAVFLMIQKKFQTIDPVENYELVTGIELCLQYCFSYSIIRCQITAVNYEKSAYFYSTVGTLFAKRCSIICKEDLEEYSQFIIFTFTELLKKFISKISPYVTMGILRSLTEDSKDVLNNELALLVLKFTRGSYRGYYEEDWENFEKEMCKKLSSIDNKTIKLQYNVYFG